VFAEALDSRGLNRSYALKIMENKMYKIFIVMALALVACGDTPKKSSSKLPSNNASGNNTTNNDTSGSPNVIVNPNNFTNNTSNNATNNVVNNSTNNVNNSTNNNPNNVVDPVTQKCTGYCELIMGTCVTDNCSLTGSVETARQANLAKCMGTDADSCTSRYRSDLSFRDAVDNAPVGNCFDMDVEIGRCVGFGFEACNCPLPELDTTCTADNQCNAGYLNGSCITSAMGGPEGGVCLAMGCIMGADAAIGSASKGDANGCGPTNLCYKADATQNYCIKGCTSSSQCRPDFTCRLELELPDGTYGYCAPPAVVP